MEIFALWFIGAIIVAIIASTMDRSGFGFFVLSLLLSPVISLIILLIVGSIKVSNDLQKQGAETPETHVRCPDCRELVRADAHKCKHCGIALVPLMTTEQVDRAAQGSL